MTESVEATANCVKCGAQLSWPEDAAPDSRVICNQCGNDAGSYTNIESAAVEAVKAQLEVMIDKAFKGL